jgi:hypothetical protein
LWTLAMDRHDSVPASLVISPMVKSLIALAVLALMIVSLYWLTKGDPPSSTPRPPKDEPIKPWRPIPPPRPPTPPPSSTLPKPRYTPPTPSAQPRRRLSADEIADIKEMYEHKYRQMRRKK